MNIETLRGLGPKSVISVSLEVSCADATAAKSTGNMELRANMVSTEMKVNQPSSGVPAPWKLLIAILDRSSTEASSTAIYSVPVSSAGYMALQIALLRTSEHALRTNHPPSPITTRRRTYINQHLSCDISPQLSPVSVNSKPWICPHHA